MGLELENTLELSVAVLLIVAYRIPLNKRCVAQT